MGCIQSYFKRAATGSTQASPTDIVKHIVDYERKTESDTTNYPAISCNTSSPVNDDEANSENAERGSLHCVEATAVRTLAASTGTVAILGTTAKYNENVDYRRSVHSEQAFVLDRTDDAEYDREVRHDTPTTCIVTTAIVETPPAAAEHIADTVVSRDEDVRIVSEKVVREVETAAESVVNRFESDLPKVVDSIEKVTMRKKPPPPPPSLELESSARTAVIVPANAHVDRTAAATPDDKTNESSDLESTTTSDALSVINECGPKVDVDCDVRSLPKQLSLDALRQNRLSLGQQSIESDQNTMEISSADDVVKNESTDMSPASLQHSFDDGDSFAYDPSVSVEFGSKDEANGGIESIKDVREISNTSLNTLGDDDSNSGGSDVPIDVVYRRVDGNMKRFDTISSNGESSYRLEGHNYPSVSEQPELDEYVDEQSTPTIEDAFDPIEEKRRLVERVRESARQEVDQICEKAAQNVSEMLLRRGEPEPEARDGDDLNNYSELSALSAVDSIAAEKGSDFDSLSFFDEQSDSRSTSALGGEESSSPKGRLHEGATASPTGACGLPRHAAAAAYTRLHESNLSSEVNENTSNFSQEKSGAVINQNNNISATIVNQVDIFPRPPSVADLPPLPGNMDQYDIPVEELQSVESPADCKSGDSNYSNMPKDSLEEAAAKIQAGVRGYLTRKQMKQLKNTNENKTADEKMDTFDVDVSKEYTKSKRLSLDSKLGDLRGVRKSKLKSMLTECVEEDGDNAELEKAVVKIQSIFRNYRSRKSVCFGNTDQTTILNGGHAKSDPISPPPTAPIETNKLDRIEGTENKNQSTDTERNLSKTDTNTDEDPLKQAVIKIQSTYRGFRARKSIQISASAATKIQAHFRGYKVRKSMKRCQSLNDLRNSASSSRSNIDESHHQQQELEKQITKIQAGVRGYLVRKRHSLQNNAAAKIQINYRKYKSRKQNDTNTNE